jgi:hypothetical protein
VDGAPMPPRPVVAFNTAGDELVPSGTGYAFARAAGTVPFLPPSFAATHPEWAEYATPEALWQALGGKSPNDVLVEGHVLEGLARLGRTRGSATCQVNYTPSDLCAGGPPEAACETALYDADWLAEGKNLWGASHPDVPLRLARAADARAVDIASLADAWAPRLMGRPLAPDEHAWHGSRPLLGVLNAYVDPRGTHVFVNGDPCKAFDDAVYYNHLLVRFLATEGRDLYHLSHPTSHACLERETCPFF